MLGMPFNGTELLGIPSAANATGNLETGRCVKCGLDMPCRCTRKVAL